VSVGGMGEGVAVGGGGVGVWVGGAGEGMWVGVGSGVDCAQAARDRRRMSTQSLFVVSFIFFGFLGFLDSIWGGLLV